MSNKREKLSSSPVSIESYLVKTWKSYVCLTLTCSTGTFSAILEDRLT